MGYILSKKNLLLPVIHGTVAEWLGRALQKLVQRFESARCLFFIPSPQSSQSMFLRLLQTPHDK